MIILAAILGLGLACTLRIAIEERDDGATLRALLDAYQEELEIACSSGAFTAEACAAHRRALLDAMKDRAEGLERLAAQEADGSRLRDLARAIRRLARHRGAQ